MVDYGRCYWYMLVKSSILDGIWKVLIFVQSSEKWYIRENRVVAISVHGSEYSSL